MKKALFVTYGGGHVNIVRHVHRVLENEGFDSQIIGLTNSGTILDKEDIQYKKISDYISVFDYKETVLKFGEQLLEEHYDINSGLSKFDIAVYLGINFYDLVESIGSPNQALEIFKEKGHKIFNPIKSMKKILEFEKPDIVILTCNVRMEKAAGIAANELGIPVLMILGTIGDDDIIPYQCKVCVMNGIAKKNLIQNNSLNEKDIIITGQPDYEENIKVNFKILKSIREQIKADRFKKIITFVPQPKQKDNKVIMNKLVEISLNNMEHLYIIKLHPNEFIQEYKSFIDLKIDNLLITKEAELPYYLYLSDLIITKFSMGGLYAVFMDKPMIVLNIFNEELYPDYSKYGVAISVTDISKLEENIKELLFIESEPNKILMEARNDFYNVENSVNNIIQVIKSITYHS